MTGGFLSDEVLTQYMPTKDHKKIDRKFVWAVYGSTNSE
jgi:hypothetical protein